MTVASWSLIMFNPPLLHKTMNCRELLLILTDSVFSLIVLLKHSYWNYYGNWASSNRCR